MDCAIAGRRADDMHRSNVEVMDERCDVGGVLGDGVAADRARRSAGTAVIRQHDEMIGGKTFDLRTPAGAGAAETRQEQNRRPAPVSE